MSVDIEQASIKIINDGKYLYATMPNGDIIPMQVNNVTEQDMVNPGLVMCKVVLTAAIPLKDFEIITKILADNDTEK